MIDPSNFMQLRNLLSSFFYFYLVSYCLKYLLIFLSLRLVSSYLIDILSNQPPFCFLFGFPFVSFFFDLGDWLHKYEISKVLSLEKKRMIFFFSFMSFS